MLVAAAAAKLAVVELAAVEVAAAAGLTATMP